MSYKISKVVFVEDGVTSIPQFGYIEVTGPKGGRYILDEFNSDIVCLIATEGYSYGTKASDILARYGREKEIFIYAKMSMDSKILKCITDKCGGTLLSKLSGKDKAKLIAIDLSDVDKELLEKHTQEVVDDKLTKYMQRNRK